MAVDEFGDFPVLKILFRWDDGRVVVVSARLGAGNSVKNLKVLSSISRNDDGRTTLEALPAALMTTVTDTLLAALSLAD